MAVAGHDRSASWLGIDFGTCYSSAARVVDGRPVAIKEPMRHGYSVPSSVLVLTSGSRAEHVVGMAAESQKLFYPDAYVSEFKRELGRKDPLLLGDERVPVEDLVADVLAFLRAEAGRAGRGDPDCAVVTIPASYTPHLRGVMTSAAEKAGFGEVELLTEPVAALLEHAHAGAERDIADGLVLVYDLGGGTFDAALVAVDGSEHEVLAYDGVADVGGSNFDLAIERDLAEQAGDVLKRSFEGASDRDHPNHTQALSARLSAREACRIVKHDLSEMAEAATSLLLPAGPVRYELTRDQLAAMIRPELDRTIECCRAVLEESGKDWSDVDGILMVGGSCRLPFIGEVIAQESGRPIWRVADPELAVCEGAALRAREIATPASRDIVVDPSGGGHATIAAAVAEAPPGARIVVLPGEYDEQLVLDKDVTLFGEGLRKKIALSSGSSPLVTCTGAVVRIEGITLRVNEGPGIDVTAGSTTIEDCEITVAAGPAVRVDGDVDVTLDGNRIVDPVRLGAIGAPPLEGAEPDERAPTSALVAAGGARVTLEHNTVSATSGVGILVSGTDTSVVCRDNNRIHDTGDSAVKVTDGARCVLVSTEITVGPEVAGVEVLGALTRAELSGNVVRKAGIGFFVAEDADLVAEDNELFDISAAAIFAASRLGDTTIRRNLIERSNIGVQVAGGCDAKVDKNTITGSIGHAIRVSGEGTSAELHENRLLESRAAAVGVDDGAAVQLLENEIVSNAGSGVIIGGASTSAAMRGNVLGENAGAGLLVADGASVEAAGNTFRANTDWGAQAVGAGSRLHLDHDQIHANEGTGLCVTSGATAHVKSCDIHDNGTTGVFADGAETSVSLTSCRVAGHAGEGALVSSSARAEVSETWFEDNARYGVRFVAPVSGDSRIEDSYVRGSASCFGGPLVEGVLGKNDLGLVAGRRARFGQLARHFEDGRIEAADELSIEILRSRSGCKVVDDMTKANALPTDVLNELHELWLGAVGSRLRDRPWVTQASFGVTTHAILNTYLQKRLKQLGL